MSVDVEIVGGVAVMKMSGQFNFQVHRPFKEAYGQILDNASVNDIEIDMSKLDYMDSSALGMLMLLNERAKAAHKNVVLVNPSGAVSQVLAVANFGKIFNIRNR